MATKTKVKGATRQSTYAPITTQAQAEDALREVGEHRREVLRIETQMNDEIAAIKQKYETQAEPTKSLVSERVEALQAWAEANREELTNNGKRKTVPLATGEITWRTRPPKVTIRKKDDVLRALADLGLGRFIRTSQDVDKEAMLKEPTAVSALSGITIGSAGEDFAVEPYEMEIDNKQ